MPSAYTHYRFGKEVLSCLPKHFRRPIEEYRELFDIGLHGPDILFYYKPLSKNPVNQLGHDMHHQPASTFFQTAAEVWRSSKRKEALQAYLYGFICHFALDSICHPYIEKMVAGGEFSHTELETELDRFFLLKDELDPMTYLPIQHIHPTLETCDVIAECYSSISEKEVRSSLRGMIWSFKLLNAQTDFKRKLILLVMKLTGNAKFMSGLVMKPEANEQCQAYCPLLYSKYLEAVTTAASLIQQYGNVLEHNADLSTRFNQTFDAGEHWEELYI